MKMIVHKIRERLTVVSAGIDQLERDADDGRAIARECRAKIRDIDELLQQIDFEIRGKKK